MNRLLGIIAIVGIGVLVYTKYKEAIKKDKLKVKK
jgi:hypothetical protein